MPAGFGSCLQVQGEGAPERRPAGGAKAGEGARAPPYIDMGDTFARLGQRSCRRRTGRRRISVILGEIELVGSDHRNRGRREGGLLELPVKVNPANFPVAQGVFEMHGAFPGLRGLGQTRADRRPGPGRGRPSRRLGLRYGQRGKRGTWQRLQMRKTCDFLSTATLLLITVLYHSLCAAENKADVISPTAYQTDGAKPSLRFAWERMPQAGGGSNDFHQVLQSGPRGHRSIRDQNQPERF